MVNKINPLRSAFAFFLIAVSTAFLFSLGARMTGWFTAPAHAAAEPDHAWDRDDGRGHHSGVGARGFRRMTSAELQSALLGASAVLLATATG